ncbi:hypothetical protein GC194_04285 [bacterium]|nr:hypothetical protein [bacterium]
MSKKIKGFKFQGLFMELTLVVVNVFLVLALIFIWNNFFQDQQASKDKDFEYQYVRAGEDSQGTK